MSEVICWSCTTLGGEILRCHCLRTLCDGCGHTAPCVCTGCPCAVSDGREG